MKINLFHARLHRLRFDLVTPSAILAGRLATVGEVYGDHHGGDLNRSAMFLVLGLLVKVRPRYVDIEGGVPLPEVRGKEPHLVARPMVTFDLRKLVAGDRILVVSLDGLVNILHFDLHRSKEHHLTNAYDWEWLLVRGTQATAKAIGLTIVTCRDKIV